MADPAFSDKGMAPEAGDLAQALGRSHALWDRLREELAERHAPTTETWKFFKHWTLQVRRKKRTVLWMTPHPKHCLAATALGEKAVEAAREADLPPATWELIENAPRYPEGRGVRVEVRVRRDLEIVLAIAAIKMA
jgi:hypothetical protein